MAKGNKGNHTKGEERADSCNEAGAGNLATYRENQVLPANFTHGYHYLSRAGGVLPCPQDSKLCPLQIEGREKCFFVVNKKKFPDIKGGPCLVLEKLKVQERVWLFTLPHIVEGIHTDIVEDYVQLRAIKFVVEHYLMRNSAGTGPVKVVMESALRIAKEKKKGETKVESYLVPTIKTQPALDNLLKLNKQIASLQKDLQLLPGMQNPKGGGYNPRGFSESDPEEADKWLKGKYGKEPETH